MNSNFSIVILAAGLGKRMQNTDIPKVLALLKLNPLLYYVLNAALQLQPQKICLVVGHKRELVIDYVNNTFIPNYNRFANKPISVDLIKFAMQHEQLGTGHAVQCTESFLDNYNGKILILSGDVPLLSTTTLQQFIHNSAGSDIAVLTAFAQNSFGYGRIIRNANGKITSIVEEKDATDEQKLIDEINSGVYFADAKLLYSLLAETKNNNTQKEFYLTDIISIGLQKQKQVLANTVASFNEIMGVNTVQQLLELESIM